MCDIHKSHERLNLHSTILTIDKSFPDNEFISSKSCYKVIMLLKKVDNF